MTRRYRCESLSERREIVFTLMKNGFHPTSYTLADIDDPSDFEEYPVILIDESGEIGLGGAIPFDSDPFDSKKELYEYYGITNISMYRVGTLTHYFI